MLLYFSDVAFFTSGRLEATLPRAGLLVPFSQQHGLASCLCVTFWLSLQYFERCHYYYL